MNDAEQVPQFRVDIFRRSDGVSDFSPQLLSITPPQTMHGHSDRSFTETQPRRDLGIRGGRLRGGEITLNRVEEFAFAGSRIFLLEPDQNAVKEGERPLPFVGFFRG